MTKAGQSHRGGAREEDETELWRRVTSGVKPIRRRGENAPPVSPSADRDEPVKPRVVQAPATKREPSSTASSKEPELSHGRATGLDKRSLTRLRRGQLAIDAAIDLHRHTQEQAHHALDAFLARSQNAGHRCVLVITGKGFGADGSVGVLRREVPRWLNQPPNRQRVLAFSHAVPADGGEGALYVLLRRIRRLGVEHS